MLTLFALPKPFKGHVGVIQRNAISQWVRLCPRPEILLFGNEEGTAEIAQELGLRHVPEVNRNEYGTPLVSDLFEKAQTLASWNTLCYVNADIMLLGEFMKAVQQVVSWRHRFLMVGIRRDVDLDDPSAYQSPGEEARLRALVFQQNQPISVWGIDYLAFPRGLLSAIPPFAIGRCHWDNWLLWKARQSKAALVDASDVVLAVHQNHDYSHHPQGKFGVFNGEEALQSTKLAGRRVYTIEDATHRVTPDGIRYNFWHFLAPRLRVARVIRLWYFAFLKLTGPVRHPLGLRQEKITKILTRVGLFSSR